MTEPPKKPELSLEQIAKAQLLQDLNAKKDRLDAIIDQIIELKETGGGIMKVCSYCKKFFTLEMFGNFVRTRKRTGEKITGKQSRCISCNGKYPKKITTNENLTRRLLNGEKI